MRQIKSLGSTKQISPNKIFQRRAENFREKNRLKFMRVNKFKLNIQLNKI